MKKSNLCEGIVCSLLPLMLLAQVERWVYRYNGGGNNVDRANSIVYGTDGYLYAAGSSTGIGTSQDFTIISLTSSGQERWVYRYDGTGNSDDCVNSIVYGSDGNIYAAGYSYGSGTASDFTVISLTSTGQERWIYRHDGIGNSDDRANSIVYGVDGNIYAAGYSYGNGTSADFIVISFTPFAQELWIYRYNGPGNDYDRANSIVYGFDGNLYVAGYSYGSGTNTDFTVISLEPTTGIEEEKVESVEGSNFGATIIRDPLVLPENKKCKVFDITGRVVKPDKVKPGIYFIQIDGKITRKVVKVR